jgi:hypothetical protein
LVRPPRKPLEAGNLTGWPAVEQKLGTPLPTDYRDFILTYGTGLFASFYLIYNPFSVCKWLNLHQQVERLCGEERAFKREFPEVVPYRIFPERPGLLPWAGDENGNYYYWLTEGPPDSWMVISQEGRGEGFREYGRCMTDFFCDVFTGKIEALCGEYPETEHLVFEPIDNRGKSEEG